MHEEDMSPSGPPQQHSLESIYCGLASQATEATSVFSSIGRMMKEPTVQEIIKLGTDVLPLVFQDLRTVDSSVRELIIEPGTVDFLPFVFDDLKAAFRNVQVAHNKFRPRPHGCHWQMGVVRAILEKNGLPPVEIPDEFRGRVEEMIRIYVEYGHDHGYI